MTLAERGDALQADNQTDTQDFGDLVRTADRYRDARDMRAAARHYQAALDVDPSDFGIWVQLGHALKEVGQFGRAEDAYMRAHALRPADTDLLVQLGHFHASKGDTARALEFYQRAIAAGARDEHAMHYISRNASLAAPVAANDPVPAVYLDLSDLVDYLRHSRFPTGIQRMEIELFKASLRWTGSVPIRACAYSHPARSWVDLDPALFGALCELASVPGSTEDPDWTGALGAFLSSFESRRPFQPPHGAALINLGPWWAIDYMPVLREAKAAHGLRYVPFIHDIIPLLLPEELPHGNGTIFATWLSSAVAHADHIAVNSGCTQRDLVRVAEAVRPVEQPPVVVPLDAAYTLRGDAPDDRQRRAIAQQLGADGDFVLFVGTLEARKDHLMVFRAWKKLLERESYDSIPTLVCVGKPGWNFGPARHFLHSHPELEDKILILSGISDLELHSLYSECLFTVFASTYEGWGLPVTEALCHGKVCLTANHSSLPEAGGRFAEYYEPESASSFYGKLHTLIYDTAARAERERLIAAEYRPRSWPDVLANLVDGVLPHLRSVPPGGAMAAPVEAGAIYRIAADKQLSRLSRNRAVMDMLRLGRSWHNFDHERLWAMQPEGLLSFWVPEPAPDGADTGADNGADHGADLLVTLRVRAAPEPQTLTVRIGATALDRIPLEANEARTLRVVLPRAALASHLRDHTPVTLRLGVDHMVNMRAFDPNDIRVNGIGLELFSACWSTDLVSRLALLESCVTG